MDTPSAPAIFSAEAAEADTIRAQEIGRELVALLSPDMEPTRKLLRRSALLSLELHAIHGRSLARLAVRLAEDEARGRKLSEAAVEQGKALALLLRARAEAPGPDAPGVPPEGPTDGES